MQTLAHDLDANGFALAPAMLTQAECENLAARVQPGNTTSGGRRTLLEEDWCLALATRLAAHPALARTLSGQHPVQCTYFEKSPERNWLVPLHRDVHVPVAARVDGTALRSWSKKDGTWFVQPPRTVLDALVAVRVHLDSCGPDDGALEVVPGSHRDASLQASRRAGVRVVPAGVGDALVLRPLLLHASRKATGTSRRRVLHFLFGPETLPCGLRWA